jgi:antitoxin ParD1/3/4
MATMNISLPDEMKEWVEAQAATGRFANVSDYMRDLVRRDQERDEARARLQTIVDEALASGSREITDLDAYFEEIKQRAHDRLKTSDAA